MSRVSSKVFPRAGSKIDSFSRGGGTAFSLLPAQNATGNWVKIAPSAPVKIRVVDPDPKFPTRIATSGSVRVHFGVDRTMAGMILARELGMQSAIAAMFKVYLWIAAAVIAMIPIVVL